MQFRFLIPFLFTPLLGAQQPAPNPEDRDMSHMQQDQSHDGFMQGGMHHAIARGVTLDAKSDSSVHVITLRVGPLSLPANTSHMKMPQPPDLVWTLPVSGWLLAYHPKLVDASDKPVPGTVLHHVAFWNENRSDFLCPNKDEHIFGAGGELTDWAQVPGFGYRVEKGDRIRVETMVHNPTAIAYDQVFLEVAIPYADDSSPDKTSVAPVRNVYPAWMDVGSCGNSSYELRPGSSKKTGDVRIKFSGVLLGVGGHMHDYGEQLTLEVLGAEKSEAKNPLSDGSRTDLSLVKKPVATLLAKTDDQGRLLGIPVVTFFQTGGFPLASGETLLITSTYNNPTGKLLHNGAMGIVVGYFVPADPASLNSLRHPVSKPPFQHHMSHD